MIVGYMKERGFSLVEGLLICIVVCVVGFGGWYVNSQQDKDEDLTETAQQDTLNSEEVGETIEDEKTDVESGVITGTVSYPSDGIPALAVCALNTDTAESFCTKNINEKSYNLTVSPGNYFVYGHLLRIIGYVSYAPYSTHSSEYPIGGGECTNPENAFPKIVNVSSGVTVSDISISQWSLVPGDCE